LLHVLLGSHGNKDYGDFSPQPAPSTACAKLEIKPNCGCSSPTCWPPGLAQPHSNSEMARRGFLVIYFMMRKSVVTGEKQNSLTYRRPGTMKGDRSG
jgi:hypothetical protein